MVINIILAVLTLGLSGLCFGALLTYAGNKLGVKTDERVALVEGCLPGVNCGGCGCAGCADYAASVVGGKLGANLCTVGGADVTARISGIMGVEPGETARLRAQVMCSGTHSLAKRKYQYLGIMDCEAAARLAGGDKECPNGCLGLGTCAAKCPYDAIRVRDGVAAIQYDRCHACGTCVGTCPKHLIKIIPYKKTYWVGCMSMQKGAVTRKYCDVGCIGCRLCEKACTHGAIRVLNNVAEIDYSKCVECGECIKACPRKIIWSKETQRRSVFVDAKNINPDAESKDERREHH